MRIIQEDAPSEREVTWHAISFIIALLLIILLFIIIGDQL